MGVSKVKKEYIEIFNKKDLKLWANQDIEEGRSVMDTDWYYYLSDSVELMRKGEDLHLLAPIIYNDLLNYIGSNYSPIPAADIMLSLERIDVTHRENKWLVLVPSYVKERMRKNKFEKLISYLITKIYDTGFERCGTSTVIPFIGWIRMCGSSLKEMRDYTLAPF